MTTTAEWREGPGSKMARPARSIVRKAACGLGRASLAGVLALGGCVQAPLVDLPNLAKDTRPVLTAEQQTAAAKELAAKKDAEHAAAVKKIETK
jgi:hypothetical protein